MFVLQFSKTDASFSYNERSNTDHGEGRSWGRPFILSRYGSGFGYQIPHFVLDPEAKAAFKFNYRIIGISMG